MQSIQFNTILQSSTVHMTSTLDASTEQIPISFKDPVSRRPRHERLEYYDEDEYAIWSCKFSADGNEVIAGGNRMIFGTNMNLLLLVFCRLTCFP